MTRICFGLILLTLFGCKKPSENVFESELSGESNAQWIQDGRELPVSDSLFYLERPTPLFRKEFNADNEIESAKLYITAAGYYKALMNGLPVGKNVLDPAWTDYSKRIYYSEYDVTSLVNEGNNCLGVVLGNGFYNPLPLQKWGHRNLRNDLPDVGKPVFIARLIMNYMNGRSEEVVTDTSWKYCYGPLLKNSVYLGVLYDAQKEIRDWDNAGFNDQPWSPAEIGKDPLGELQKTFFPSVQITEEIIPVEIYSPDAGVYIVDMGINFTGTYKIKLSGITGDTITFRFGERIYEDSTLNPMTTVAGQIKKKGMGGPGAPEIAWQEDNYIIGNSDIDWFVPNFTYHTYRYMEITGLKYKPQIADIKGLFIHSAVADLNNFTCSSELLNSIQAAVVRTFRANLVSVQSDCPAREKFGYGGDLNATSESFIYNFDMQAFYRKTIYDWVDAINDSIFVDTAPYVGIKYCGISWESAFLITQYYLYLYYNDISIIGELYELDKQWMDKVARIHPEGIVNKGLSDHESLEPVTVELTGTCHYLQCARIMKTFASVMRDDENEKRYGELADKLKNLLKAEFWDKPVKKNINRQTLFATLLYHGIVPPDETDAATDSLINAVKNGPSGHFSTGIFGTKYILETLSENIDADFVYDIVNSTTFPGWGFMIDNGATTIWETWKESDNTYSNCHPMFGTVTEWFYRWLGGIRPDPQNPGFKEFILAPSTPEGLEFVRSCYHSPFGQIMSNWERDKNGTCRFVIKIPPETRANVILPLDESQKIKIEKEGKIVKEEEIAGLRSGKFQLGKGNYVITTACD
jgi:alpha-L-rhamnosidase